MAALRAERGEAPPGPDSAGRGSVQGSIHTELSDDVGECFALVLCSLEPVTSCFVSVVFDLVFSVV